jgi:hypothetical protein
MLLAAPPLAICAPRLTVLLSTYAPFLLSFHLVHVAAHPTFTF